MKLRKNMLFLAGIILCISAVCIFAVSRSNETYPAEIKTSDLKVDRNKLPVPTPIFL